jgi:hypothetical protein
VLIALVGDGYYELVKHTVLAGYATALLLAVTAGALVSMGVQRPRSRHASTRKANSAMVES